MLLRSFALSVLLLLTLAAPSAATYAKSAPLAASIRFDNLGAPTTVSPPHSISAGDFHACALRPEGTIVCWGSNDYGQVTPPSGSFTAVAAGGTHSCALRFNATIACWGSNTYGEATPPSGNFKAVTAGEYHSCALRTDGTIACWGRNENGQLNNIPSGAFTAISSGAQRFHTCAMRADGALACWGRNAAGQVSGVPSGSFTAISAGGFHGCALKADGTIACWGYNNSGQATPLAGSFTTISVGGLNSCAIRADATLACWGSDSSNQPTTPSGTFSAVSVGSLYMCAIRTDGTAICWGRDFSGQLTSPPGVFGPELHWTIGGNSDTTPGPNFLGTTDNHSLELRVNGRRALRLGPNAISPTLLGGSGANTLTAGVAGATISGGGSSALPNSVSDDYGTVSGGGGNTAGNTAGTTSDRTYATVGGGSTNTASGSYATISGGYGNTAGGSYATVAGGATNSANGAYAFAAGRRAQAGYSGSFVWADGGSASFAASAANQFNVRSTGGVRIVSAVNSSGIPTAGVYLAPGANSWQALPMTSDRNLKANFATVDTQRILQQVLALPVQLWNYTGDEQVQHIGPMAQDFAASFGVGENDTTISPIDANGVALAAIQGLNQKVEDRDRQIAALQQRVLALEASQRTPVSTQGASVGLSTSWPLLVLAGVILSALLVGSSVGLTLMLLRRRPRVH